MTEEWHKTHTKVHDDLIKEINELKRKVKALEEQLEKNKVGPKGLTSRSM